MRDQDVRSLELVIIADGPDSEIATMFEGVLEDDLNDFFFGCTVTVATKEQDETKRKDSRIPRPQQTPL